MIRRLSLFVILPVALGYGLAMLAISLGVRGAGVHWLNALPYYLMFGLPGLAVATALGRGRRRDFVEMAGLLSAMLVSYALVEGLGSGLWFYAVFDTFLAALVLGTVLLSARFLQCLMAKLAGGNVR
jgi:hypothetical protein